MERTRKMTRNLRKLYSVALAMLVTLLLPVAVLAAGKEIIILHTNDIHCGISDNLGIDKVSQYKKNLKKEGYPVALVDAGDAIQGAPIGTLSNGESIIKIMNAVGFDFAIPGNHEFDYGMERFLKLASRQKCGYYSCNFVDVKTRKPILKILGSRGHKGFRSGDAYESNLFPTQGENLIGFQDGFPGFYVNKVAGIIPAFLPGR